MFPLNVYTMTDLVYLPLFDVSLKCTHYDEFLYLPLFPRDNRLLLARQKITVSIRNRS